MYTYQKFKFDQALWLETLLHKFNCQKDIKKEWLLGADPVIQHYPGLYCQELLKRRLYKADLWKDGSRKQLKELVVYIDIRCDMHCRHTTQRPRMQEPQPSQRLQNKPGISNSLSRTSLSVIPHSQWENSSVSPVWIFPDNTDYRAISHQLIVCLIRKGDEAPKGCSHSFSLPSVSCMDDSGAGNCALLDTSWEKSRRPGPCHIPASCEWVLTISWETWAALVKKWS